MLHVYPEQAADSLEFSKVRTLLFAKCRTDEARSRVEKLRFMSRLEPVSQALQQTAEFKNTLGTGDFFPGGFTRNMQQELRLITVTGATLSGESLASLRSLAKTIQEILAWFKGHAG